MRAYILISALLVYFQTESVMICDVCDCEQKSEPPTVGVVVNCSFHDRVLEVDPILPEASITLDLSRSNLTTIQQTSTFQSETLGELLLNRNLLKEINLDLFQLPELKKLDLSENEIQQLNPNSFKSFTKLEYLNLANNKFTTMSQLNFNFLVNLKEIILDNNNLGDDIETRSLFEAQGYGLPLNIQSVSIRGVNLNNLNLEYFKPVDKTLRKLIISNNNLSTLDEALSVLFVKVKRLDLQQNPWICDCHLAWLRKLKISPDLIEELRCSSPQHLIGKRIFDLDEKDFTCLTSSLDESQFEITIGHWLYLIIAFVTIMYLSLHNAAPKDSLRQK